MAFFTTGKNAYTRKTPFFTTGVKVDTWKASIFTTDIKPIARVKLVAPLSR